MTAPLDDSAGAYLGSHRPPVDGDPLHDLGQSIPPDCYQHPEWYAYGDQVALCGAIIRQARGCPDQIVRVFRAVPPGVDTINTGDWVTTVEGYARTHAMINDNPADDWPVLSIDVPAHQIRYGGSDLVEWGYWGAPVVARVLDGSVSA